MEIRVSTASVIIREDRRTTVREIVSRINIAIGSVLSIFNVNFTMRRVSYRWIPRLLSNEQMAHRVSICNELLMRYKGKGIVEFRNAITVDESWMYHYDP